MAWTNTSPLTQLLTALVDLSLQVDRVRLAAHARVLDAQVAALRRNAGQPSSPAPDKTTVAVESKGDF